MLAAGLAILAATTAVNSSLPVVTFAHPGVIEQYCREVSPNKPDAKVVSEIDQRIGDFEKAWSEDGPKWMAETERLVGRPYQFHETLATLHGCPDLPTMGLPLLINVVRFTQAYVQSSAMPARLAILGATSPQGPRSVRPMSDFVHDVWNELNRRYVRTIRRKASGGTTPLLRKYSQESIVTQRNLHLIALDELVSARLGKQDQFDRRAALIRASGAKDLIRAYSIVGKEGAERFVAELRL